MLGGAAVGADCAARFPALRSQQRGCESRCLPRRCPPPPHHVLNATTLPLLQRCETCKQTVPGDCPVVYADRAGYSRQWHPACFVCCRCSEPLVDLIYFWKSGAAWCGRHYCESLRPRCAGCDEVGTGRRPPAQRSLPGLLWPVSHPARPPKVLSRNSIIWVLGTTAALGSWRCLKKMG